MCVVAWCHLVVGRAGVGLLSPSPEKEQKPATSYREETMQSETKEKILNPQTVWEIAVMEAMQEDMDSTAQSAWGCRH